MDLEINWLAVLVATVASLIAVGAWYTNTTFGPAWRKLTGVTVQDSERGGNKPMILAVVANAVTALVMAAAITITAGYFDNSSLWLALLVGLVTWLAFSATTLLTHNAFEQKPDKLTLINNGYQLALFLILALVIGLFSL